jgi:hypothetical protein
MSESKLFHVAAPLALLMASSATMLWLFWRFPIPTFIGTVALLATLLHCVRIATFMDLAASTRTVEAVALRELPIAPPINGSNPIIPRAIIRAWKTNFRSPDPSLPYPITLYDADGASEECLATTTPQPDESQFLFLNNSASLPSETIPTRREIWVIEEQRWASAHPA